MISVLPGMDLKLGPEVVFDSSTSTKKSCLIVPRLQKNHVLGHLQENGEISW